MAFITAIGTANPDFRFSQTAIEAFMLRAMKLRNGDERKLKAIFRASGIDYRHSVLGDYGNEENYSFYPEDLRGGLLPGTKRRLKIFQDHAVGLSIAAVKKMRADGFNDTARKITHLITVSCTGMFAPGLDIELVRRLGLDPTVQRTAINFMGCHAAFNALKIADAICRSDKDAKVLIVCTELCSLHFQREATEDNLLANALFADGSAAVLVEALPGSPLGLRLEGFHSDLSADGMDDMSWSIGELGFEMRLSSYIPTLISKGIGLLSERMLSKVGIGLDEITHFAIHPGGRKILEVIDETLSLKDGQNEAAYKVLRNFGNMSSPTVLFVLDEILKTPDQVREGERILSFAFGPGLTLESMILTVDRFQHA